MAARRPNPFLRAGLPMLGLTIGGFLGLRFFLQGRLDVQVGSSGIGGCGVELGAGALHRGCAACAHTSQPTQSALTFYRVHSAHELDLRFPTH